MAKFAVAKGATEVREVRPVEHLAGIGGFIEFTWRAETFPVVSRIEIREWVTDHRYVNARIAMTGGLGSIQYRRVADDFEFTAIANMDLRTTRESPPAAPGPVSQPFYDGRMEGSPDNNFLIKMHFQCGDPDFLENNVRWFHPTNTVQQGVYQTCDEVILDQVRLLDSSRGKPPNGVLRYLITGHGSKPLQRWVGPHWTGGGAFGIGKKIQGQAPDVPVPEVPL